MRVRGVVGWGVAGTLGLVALGYGATTGWAWWRYGHPAPPAPDETDPLLDRFMPHYEVVERHHARVDAPADLTLRAATDIEFEASPIVQAIFKARAIVLGARADTAPRPRGLLAQTKALGWGVLAEAPGREIVMGAVTQPWLADVVFRPLPPDQFAAFCEPGFVKIVWTLRADPDGPSHAIFRTETRVVATDPVARSRFRGYWARFSPGIALIRTMMVRELRRTVSRSTTAEPHHAPARWSRSGADDAVTRRGHMRPSERRSGRAGQRYGGRERSSPCASVSCLPF